MLFIYNNYKTFYNNYIGYFTFDNPSSWHRSLKCTCFLDFLKETYLSVLLPITHID